MAADAWGGGVAGAADDEIGELVGVRLSKGACRVKVADGC